jgi:Rrf2 family nitric oxide-sensitive transcriptional repressor
VHLTLHADYSLRVLIYLAAYRDRVVSTAEISEAYGISKNHLVRVVQSLGRYGYIEVRPGRLGGLALRRDPGQISMGEVVRKTEPHFHLVECFDPVDNTCPITRPCGLKRILFQAREAFMHVLDAVTLDDVLKRSDGDLKEYFLTKPLVRSAR